MNRELRGAAYHASRERLDDGARYVDPVAPDDASRSLADSPYLSLG